MYKIDKIIAEKDIEMMNFTQLSRITLKIVPNQFGIWCNATVFNTNMFSKNFYENATEL